MSLGTNIKKGNQNVLERKLWSLLLGRKVGNRQRVNPRIVYKAGIPASNTAADDPGAKGIVVIDTTNNKIYICTAYTSSSSFTMSAALN
jgi:hypothetical protein